MAAGGEISPTAIYSRAEAAELLNVNVRTLDRWRFPGVKRGPYHVRLSGAVTGGRVMFRGEALLRFVEELERLEDKFNDDGSTAATGIG